MHVGVQQLSGVLWGLKQQTNPCILSVFRDLTEPGPQWGPEGDLETDFEGKEVDIVVYIWGADCLLPLECKCGFRGQMNDCPLYSQSPSE